ncbi:prolyl endopeptidase FAP isoform X2 [Lepeophtheirus salmonis]|uniref:prolyl endopeptidase FAP isoform X2 n=1 Tax=Lepeophtheirus salmonis TaxID=72036 RepID=UPI003AF38D56
MTKAKPVDRIYKINGPPKFITYRDSDVDEKTVRFLRELVATSGSDRNWKGMLIAIVVILAVLGLILLSVLWMTPPPDTSPKGEKISFSDFLSNNLSGKFFNGSWVSDNEILFRDEFNCISLLDVRTLKSIVMVSNQTFNRLQPEIYSLSADKKFIYLGYNYIKNFRHSFFAKYVIYEVQTGKEFPIIETPEDEELETKKSGAFSKQEVPFLQYVEWSTVGNAYIFVYGNNLYYKKSAKDPHVYPITTNGRIGIIFNGIPDWIYEEEVFGSNKAVWFSSDGSRLCYVQFNDTNVEEISLPSYDPMDLKSTFIRYPKAGATNPTVRVYVVDIHSLQSYTVPPPRVIAQRDHYVVWMTWVDNHIISSSWINRHQNVSIIAHCEEMSNWRCKEVYRESTETGWSNMISSLHYSNRPPDTEFLLKALVMDGHVGFFRQIMRVSYGNSSIKEPLTIGRYDVTSIYGWDSINNYIYFGSSPREEPTHSHVYRIYYDASGPLSLETPLCLTCCGIEEKIEPEHEVDLWLRGYIHDSKNNILPSRSVKTGCLKNSAIFSKDFSYWVWECSGPETPPQVFLVYSQNNTIIHTLTDNYALRKRIANMSLPIVRTFSVKIPETIYNASVRLYLPPEVKHESLMTYPLIVQVYAGPETQATQADWRHGWASYLAARMGWIIALIDGRGSKGSGEKREREIWKRLGSVEVEDQITITKYLSKKIPVVDLRRIAIWGWSYGGYAALRALANPNQDIFQCAISIAPVTSWRFYDSVYTERYMGMPDINGNYLGYDQSDVTHQAVHFRSTDKTMRKLFLIHGTRDDNVHLQHSMVLAKELISKGIFFKQQIYPDATHNFQNVRHHFYLSMERFFSSCFDEVTKNDSKESLSLVNLFS